MRLGAQSELFHLAGIPMVGNLDTGGIIGLTDEGERLCRALAGGELADSQVPVSCEQLVCHLERGGYLDDAPRRGRPAVTSAYLHVTQRCNLRCRFCYSEDEGRNVLADPSIDELRSAIDLLAGLGARRLVISGGEPFLRCDLADVAALARGAGVTEVVVLTNGLLVTADRAREVAEFVGCVGIAFDGCSAGSVAHLRGEQNFDALVRAVRAVLDAGMEARILPTLHGRNLGDLTRYRELAERLGATLSFSLLTAPERLLGDYAMSHAALAELGRRSAEGEVGYGEELPSGLAARRSCGAGVRTLSVAADGAVYPCHMLHDPRLALGNAFVDDAAAIMSSPVARLFSTLDARRFEECGRCDKRALCAGGCRARALMSTGEVGSRDPYCELFRSYYEHMGERIAQRVRPERR